MALVPTTAMLVSIGVARAARRALTMGTINRLGNERSCFDKVVDHAPAFRQRQLRGHVVPILESARGTKGVRTGEWKCRIWSTHLWPVLQSVLKPGICLHAGVVM